MPRCPLGGPFIRRRAGALAARTLEAMPSAMEGIVNAGFEEPDLQRIADFVRSRAIKVHALAATGKGATA
jgi:hypothetical protein